MAFRLKNRLDIGLLIIRIGLGVMFIMHGLPKITGGPERWEKLGGAMSNLGIDFLPVVWGFLAAFAEFFGGIFLIFGLMWAPATLMLFFTMFVAALVHINNGDGFKGYAHAVEVGIVFLGLFFTGPGKYIIRK